MSAVAGPKILTSNAPGEFRAVLLSADGRPAHLFYQRWKGARERARYGDVLSARIRKFSDELRGAFLELESGEEAFLSLKSRDGLTEGASIGVIIRSEARQGKLARASLTDAFVSEGESFQRWQTQICEARDISFMDSPEQVDAIFEDATERSVTLPGGGRLHIDRTRALTAFDVDTSGRTGKGSAGARALSINREAAVEMVRQTSLRGLGGNLVLDCVGPSNPSAGDQIRDATRNAFAAYHVSEAKVLKPSSLGLLEASAPWRFLPLEDYLLADPAETELLRLLKDAQREATTNPANLYELSFGSAPWRAYQSRKTEADLALNEHFGMRLTLSESATTESRISKR